MTRRNPFAPGARIQHGNAGIDYGAGDVLRQTATAARDLAQATDELIDPELRVLSHLYGARMQSTPHPSPPEPLS